MRYLKAHGIQAKFSTLYRPQGNATVERFMQPLRKALKTAEVGRRPWRQELNRFLLQYRNEKEIIDRHKEARDNKITRMEGSKDYAHHPKAKKSEIQIGDYVLVRQERKIVM